MLPQRIEVAGFRFLSYFSRLPMTMAAQTPSHHHVTQLEVQETVHIGQRISIGLIALSLSTFSLALGLAFIKSPAPLLVVAPPIKVDIAPSSATAVTLNWTTPEAETGAGEAIKYDLRYADFPITTENFSDAIRVRGLPTPQVPGRMESFTITNLNPNTTYFIAMKWMDADGNVSTLSNVTTKTTELATIACLPEWTCSAWSGCINGHQNRTCTTSNACTSDVGQPITEQSCTNGVYGIEPVAIRNPILVAGVGPGVTSRVRIIDPVTLKVLHEIIPFGRENLSGTNVATGDIDHDGDADILVGAGAGSEAMVKYFSSTGKLIAEFQPYPASPEDGASVAVDDVNGDGIDEVVTLPARGSAQLRIFQYSVETQRFTALAQTLVYPRSNQNGFTLATGDLNLDSRADIVIAPRANGRSVTAVSLNADQTFTRLVRLNPENQTFTSGLTVAVADINGDGQAEIVTTAGPGYYSHLKIWSVSGALQAEFRPSSAAFRGGLDLAAFDVDQDGREEIITSSFEKGNPELQIFSLSPLTQRFERTQNVSAYPRSLQVGLRIDAAPRI